ncbi:tRNA (adenosine(37)-N6)-dimethylallyltransferase MiaA [Glaciecola sp. XM2]|uniref:tRNA (adenosine(37)-N6)-dimethylallyltransferase MiaA n=1 Tax=Glaciecola sp. XM2 TaxID=1914931 RepID=UPI001BDE85F8|nr:tRNA (adenosine(37)-N6)-dimethylallyltransferase MiaA [Glaciecola sp. XM2]MBT1449976.1 tRNA (adenosine(37)-N6)-dimethylallyltransferase MiaA [Glaciecola sp. XM2]
MGDVIETPVVCIMGPTASGKTGLAIELAKHINGEVISVDSALIYREMDIGTAKPDAAEQQGVKHWLIDIRTPEQAYSVADFVKDAAQCIDDIQSRGKVAILAGGTMMYFNALLNGISEIPSSDPKIREAITAELALKGSVWLHQALMQVDPISANKIHQNDPQRLTRAMEVYQSTRIPLSQWQKKKQNIKPYRFINFSIMPSLRSDLHQRIATRFTQMLSNGLVDEVKQLQQSYTLTPDMPSMRSVGYRQTLQYLSGEYDLKDLEERGIIATRQLAKRQITWLRGWENIFELDTHAPDNLDIVVQKVCAINR